jgi:hypothetical protein
VALTRPRHALYVIAAPAKKAAFENKTAASLLYHGLGCTTDPTEERTVWFERGDSQWHRQEGVAKSPATPAVPPRQVRLQPLAPVPLRNRIVDNDDVFVL